MASPATGDERSQMSSTLARHTLIYGIGQVLTRLGSILLLPFYTHYLTPRDYGVIALVDVVVGLLGVIVGGQAAAAATKHHFSAVSALERGRVWWNAVWLLLVLDLVVVAPALLGAPFIAGLVFGEEVSNGSLLVLLALTTLALSPVEQVGLAYLRAEKKSITVISLSFARLLLNIAINVLLVGKYDMGAAGVLIGNLATAVIFLVAVLAVSIARLPCVAPHRKMLTTLWAFSAPMFITGVLQLVMHEAGRISLRVYGDIADVGVYGLAFQIGQGVNSLAIMPFSMIFVPLAFEVAKSPQANWFYVNAFRMYYGVLAALLFAVAAMAPEIFSLLIGEQFAQSAELVPVICLAFFVYSLHSHFSIPALVADRTIMLIPATVIAAVAAVCANVLLVPKYGVHGATVALLIGYSTYSLSGLFFYRRIRKLSYDFLGVVLLVVAMTATLWACMAWRRWTASPWDSLLPVACVVGWTLAIALWHRWKDITSVLSSRSN